MDLGLAGCRALVLGSTSGLGRAVAQALVAEGAHVAVSGRSREPAAGTAAAIGARASVVADLREPGAGTRVVEDAAAALGGLDACVVNTGGGLPGGLMEAGGEADTAYHSMLRPALEVARASAPLLGEEGRGRLLFLTARSVVEATPSLALSSVMRSGVAAAARSLAVELAPDVLVNVVATGQFDTPSLARYEEARASSEGRTPAAVRADHVAAIPVGRLGEAHELADVVAFLCSARASFVTGTVVRVDGGAVRGFYAYRLPCTGGFSGGGTGTAAGVAGEVLAARRHRAGDDVQQHHHGPPQHDRARLRPPGLGGGADRQRVRACACGRDAADGLGG